MPETIEISYNNTPRGQMGPRPRKIPLNTTFLFTCKDPGVLTIEFTGDSPLADGTRTAPIGKALKPMKLGRFKFKCVLDQGGQKITLGDPDDPSSEAGGELEIVP